MKLKKFVAGALAAVVAVGSLSISAFADTGDTWEYDGYICEELEDGTLSVYYIGDDSIDIVEVEEIVIPSEINGKTVTEIAEYGFSMMSNLKSVTIPDTVRKIGDQAFYHCGLTSIEIPASVTEIGYRAFFQCMSLVSVNMSNGLEKIGEEAFFNCINLASIDIPDSVTEIGKGAFFSCDYAVGSVEISDNVTEIGVGAFSGCSSLSAINVDKENLNYASVEGVLFDKDVTDLICYPGGKEDKEYTIPDSVTQIIRYAFFSCRYLNAITIPASVIEIGDHAFSGFFKDFIIYGYVGSATEEYAEMYGHDFVALPVSLENNEVEIKGVLPYDTTLNVGKGTETETSIAYDITLENSNGDPVQPDTEVSVTILVPEELAGADNYYVYYQNGDNLTDMNATYDKDNNCITFTTTHFSTYIISTVALTEDNSQNGGSGTGTGSGSGTGTGGTSTGTTNTDNTDTTTPTDPDTTQPSTSVPDTTPDDGKDGEDGAENNGSASGDNPYTGVTLLLIPALTAAAGIIISKKRK